MTLFLKNFVFFSVYFACFTISFVSCLEKKTLKDLISHLESKIMELTGEHQDGATIKKLEIVAVNQKFEESLRENEKLQETVLSLQEEASRNETCVIVYRAGEVQLGTQSTTRYCESCFAIYRFLKIGQQLAL